MCGWLLPGPFNVTPLPPRDVAICEAVVPLPYCFDESAFEPPVHVVLPPAPWPVTHDVFFDVLFDGLTPGSAGEEAAGAAGGCATVAAGAGVVATGADCGADGAFFFTCPGASADLPGAWAAESTETAWSALLPPFPLPFPFPLPLPLPAAATPTRMSATRIPAAEIAARPNRVMCVRSPYRSERREDNATQLTPLR